MNVFIIGSPLDTAKILDKKRLNKQIVECDQMLKALQGETKAWRNHPCTLQYEKYQSWLYHYMLCLDYYRKGNIALAESMNCVCESLKPKFHVEAYFKQVNNPYLKEGACQ